MCHSVELYLPRLAARAAEERAADFVPAPVPGPSALARILAWVRRSTLGNGASGMTGPGGRAGAVREVQS